MFCRPLPRRLFWLQQFRHERRPAGLMVGAQSMAIVAVEIFVEPNVVAEIGIGLKFFVLAVDGAAAGGIAEEDFCEAAGELVGDFQQREIFAGAGGAFDFEIVAVVVMVFLQ